MGDAEKRSKLPAKTTIKKGRWGRICIFFLSGGFLCANVFVEGVEYTTLDTPQKPKLPH